MSCLDLSLWPVTTNMIETDLGLPVQWYTLDLALLSILVQCSM